MPGTGILGGTFDPVHTGHLRLAVEMREMLRLDSVRLVPLGVPPHRDAPCAGDETRIAMLEAAVGSESGLLVDTQELGRTGVSYTVDTLSALRDSLPHEALYLIVGMDAFGAMDTWHRWREIPELAHIAVARRPGAALPDTGAMARLLADRAVHEAASGPGTAGRIFIQDVPELDISASRIRAFVAAGRSVRYLVPDAVLDIIMRDQLYANAG